MPDSLQPSITFPPELPVSQRKDDIARAIEANQVVIVAGATGSGKTTQLPKIALELGRTSIAHTQPRRIAARTIAERISSELGTELGDLVGYQVRFTDKASSHTKIKLMTDGILLNEMNHDRDLTKYDTIIIDEAHERSLNVDFLLGYLKRLIARRPELKVIITSATIDPESFSKHFNNAPIIEVSGRTFPVEIRYRPLVDESRSDADQDVDPTPEVPTELSEAIAAALDELEREEPGDVLVFLSGENEIRDVAENLTGRYQSARAGKATEVLPLYGRLSSAEQHRVFDSRRAPGVFRRVVLATNVAETSLTVPGIRYVIDSGLARISRYSARAKIQRLPIEAISQASANQRSGRSGRTSPGIAIRLYSEDDFAARPEFTDPEILRTNLAAVILQMISLGLGDIGEFPFLQTPDSRGVKDGIELLTELGAVRTTGKHPTLTKTGRELARLPIEPRFARMIVEAARTGVGREVLIIVAGLTIQDPRERPLESRQKADGFHARFTDPTSDFLSLLKLWDYLEDSRAELSSSAFRRKCKAEFLNYLRVREWQDVVRQLRQIARPLGITFDTPRTDPTGIHRAILSGLLSHIGLKDAAKKDYLGARGRRFVVFPGSALAKKQPAAIMSAELVETSRLFARMNASIDPAWAESLAGPLAKKSHSDPHWEKKQGAAVALEKVTLFGVPIIAKRRVQLSRIDPDYARELFIRHALVAGEWESHHSFDRANRVFRKDLEQREERTRRRDILVDDEAIFEFYDERVPADVFSQRSFEGWWRKAQHDTPQLLTMTPSHFIDESAPAVDEKEFPSSWSEGDQKLSLKYRFEPGSDDDGVTATVPLALLPRLNPEAFEAQVPGLRPELVAALIKTMPKAIRRNFVPSNDWATRLVAETVPAPDEGYLSALARTMKTLAHVPVSADDFDRERLPAHLRVTFRVIDERGKTVAVAKELEHLQKQYGSAARSSVATQIQKSGTTKERTGVLDWDFGTLDRFVDSQGLGGVIRAYPAVVDEGKSIGLSLVTSEAEQRTTSRDGIVRLLLLAVPSPVPYVRDHLSHKEKLVLATSPYQGMNALLEDTIRAIAIAALEEHSRDGLIWTRAEFETLRDEVSTRLIDSMYSTVSLVANILEHAREVDRAIKKNSSIALMSAVADVRTQLAGLIFDGFISRTSLATLPQLVRYLRGAVWRLERLSDNPGRDRAWQRDVENAVQLYTSAGGAIPLPPHSSAALVRARWLVEELRISLFAQQLGTAEPVSLKRIQKALSEG